MLDARIRPLIDRPLTMIARGLTTIPVTANQVTLAGFTFGIAAVPFLATQQYTIALGLILINRLLDGVDGALARIKGPTDLGGYLDIVLDFIFYSAVIFGFILGRPENAIEGAFLILSFIGTGSSFLAFAAMAAKRNLTTQVYGSKTIYYLGGLTEGSETITAFVLFCVFPDAFGLIAIIFGMMCWITTLGRILSAKNALSDD